MMINEPWREVQHVRKWRWGLVWTGSSIASTCSPKYDNLVQFKVPETKLIRKGKYEESTCGRLQSSCSVATVYAFRWLGDNGHKVHPETLASTILNPCCFRIGNVFRNLSYLREGGDRNAKYCSPFSQIIEGLNNSNRMRSKSLQSRDAF